MAKILILDIETSPNLAYVWGAYKQFVSQEQWVDKSYIMSFAAKWLGESGVIYEENRNGKDRKLVSRLFELLSEADIVVAHNGKAFDIPVILGRGVVHGINPPSPFHVVDTCIVARRQFRFVTNSLKNLAEELGIAEKGDHEKFPGFKLWVECIRKNPEAWEEMRKYNIQDVVTLEQLYLKLRPYITNHPHVSRGTTDEQAVACPKCEATDIHYRGWYFTKMGLAYRKFQCLECGGWGRERYSDKDLNTNDGRNAV